MTVLHLGVIDLHYADAQSFKAVRGARSQHTGGGASKTTGDVAEILEEKYKVMQTFANMHQKEISELVAEAYVRSFETGGRYGRIAIAPFARVSGEVEHLFKQFLTNREMDGKVAGVPTKAAQRGVSHRFKHPYAQRAERPSFVDTGLYRGSFKSWVDP